MVVGKNYILLGDTGLNRYYAAAERLHEISEFRQPKELDAIYKIIFIKDCSGFLFDKYVSGKSTVLQMGIKGLSFARSRKWRKRFEEV